MDRVPGCDGAACRVVRRAAPSSSVCRSAGLRPQGTTARSPLRRPRVPRNSRNGPSPAIALSPRRRGEGVRSFASAQGVPCAECLARLDLDTCRRLLLLMDLWRASTHGSPLSGLEATRREATVRSASPGTSHLAPRNSRTSGMASADGACRCIVRVEYRPRPGDQSAVGIDLSRPATGDPVDFDDVPPSTPTSADRAGGPCHRPR